MSKKWSMLLIIPLILTGSSAGAAEEEKDEIIEEIISEVPQSIFYESNQFTQAIEDEEMTEQAPQEEIGEPYELMAENDRLALYVDPKTVAIKTLNKNTGYVWSSGLDNIEEYRLNNTWQQFVQSAVTIDYVDQRGNGKTESILTNGSQPMVTPTNNGFKAFIVFIGSNIEVTLEVDLTEEGLNFRIPKENVDEGKRNLLTSLRLYPFLGASFQTGQEGYMMIPDGSGALIRYGEKSQFADAPLSATVYGRDLSVANSSNQMNQYLSLPLYGVVHGSHQNGLLSIINSGEHYAEITAYTPGVSTDFYWVSPEFHYRYNYFQPTSRDKSGVNVYQQDRNAFDIDLQVHVLENEKANYTGMAKTYQEKLLEEGQLVDREDQYKVRLEYLGSETKPGLLWNSVLPVTTVDQVREHVDELKADGLDDLLLVYRGWTKGGFTNTLPARFPVEKKIGGEDELVELHDDLEAEGIPFYLYNDFTTAYKGAGGYEGSKDVARQANSQLVMWGKTKNYNEMYFLKPEISKAHAEAAADEFSTRGLNHMAVDFTSYMLYSDFEDGKERTREDAEETYRELFEGLGEKTAALAAYMPNPYAWSGTHHYLSIPMYSSNYMMVTDTIPFLQIVLKGLMPYYSNYVNVQVNEQQDLLRMAEYGVYPSYFITGESPAILADTPSYDIFTSQFSVWKEDILSKNSRLVEVLKQVENETIEQHEMVSPGVAAVTYSNGKTIIVNYTTETFEDENVQVDSMDFTIVDQWKGA
ncbi:DUF5696 domain-containing protein [Jeotgalibacillus proteolyticus]|uniref:Uncharacterized protein n=1 Tax=Jeotgalibacillus proteolyticus TaxID=2082395 RepID=A0A2S5GA86_9BACL|nr:DUF5696 domain-containing protein [Jeotgalibacillus proteolyticus]PPA69835.1 hypothetical protein C4B60_14995 [Jeotgalibacillus proteolyticus]